MESYFQLQCPVCYVNCLYFLTPSTELLPHEKQGLVVWRKSQLTGFHITETLDAFFPRDYEFTSIRLIRLQRVTLDITQQTFTYSKSTTETVKKGVKYVQS